MITVGTNVYVGGPGSIAAFHIGTKGALTQLTGNGGEDGCVNNGGTNGCAMAPISGTVVSLAASRDNKTLYAVTDADSLLVFNRSLGTGVLNQLQTLAVPGVTGLVSVASRCGEQGDQRLRRRLGQQQHRCVHARQERPAQLSQPGTQPQTCINATGSGGCTAAPGLAQIGTLIGAVVYKTNRFAYAAGTNGVASFARDKGTLALTPLAGPGGLHHPYGERWGLPRGPGYRWADRHPDHLHQARNGLRHDLQLGRDAAPGRLARASLRRTPASRGRTPDSFQRSSSQLRSRSSA